MNVIFRLTDTLFAVIGLILLLVPMLLVTFFCYLDTGSPLFCQRRLGREQKIFVIFKFRTMKCDTPSLPTHLVGAKASTALGRFLRRYKIDELPQLANVLLGQMSLVGPRPGLESQIQLTREREIRGVFAVRPGITGLSQIRNIDMSDPKRLATCDAEMIRTLNFPRYLKIILVTITGIGAVE